MTDTQEQRPVFWVASTKERDEALRLGYEGEPAPFNHEGEWVPVGSCESLDDLVGRFWPGTYVVDFDGVARMVTVHHTTPEMDTTLERMVVAG
jgi:hypothetical protein